MKYIPNLRESIVTVSLSSLPTACAQLFFPSVSWETSVFRAHSMCAISLISEDSSGTPFLVESGVVSSLELILQKDTSNLN